MRRPKGPLPPTQLIELVRNCPQLWDTEHPDYCRSPVAKEIKWREIAAVIDMSPQILKSKWKNLRDSYAKHLRAQAGEEEAASRRYRSYAWAREMQFIAPYLSVRLAGAPLRLAAVLEVAQRDGATKRRRFKSRALKRRRRQLPPPAASAPEPSYQGLRYLDANELIFHGYAKIVNKFSARRQLETRSKIMQILAEAEAQHLEESGAEESGEEEVEEEEEEEKAGRQTRGARRPHPLVAKLEPMEPDDDSRYFES